MSKKIHAPRRPGSLFAIVLTLSLLALPLSAAAGPAAAGLGGPAAAGLSSNPDDGGGAGEDPREIEIEPWGLIRQGG